MKAKKNLIIFSYFKIIFNKIDFNLIIMIINILNIYKKHLFSLHLRQKRSFIKYQII